MLLIFIVPPSFFAVLPLLIPVKPYEAILAPKIFCSTDTCTTFHLHNFILQYFVSFFFLFKTSTLYFRRYFLWNYWIQSLNYHAGDDGSGAVNGGGWLKATNWLFPFLPRFNQMLTVKNVRHEHAHCASAAAHVMDRLTSHKRLFHPFQAFFLQQFPRMVYNSLARDTMLLNLTKKKLQWPGRNLSFY